MCHRAVSIALLTVVTAACGGVATADAGQSSDATTSVVGADVDAIDVDLDNLPPIITDNRACATNHEKEHLDLRTWTLEATWCVTDPADSRVVDAGSLGSAPASTRRHEEHRTVAVAGPDREGIRAALEAIREVRIDPKSCGHDGQRLYLTVERGGAHVNYTDTAECGRSSSYVTSIVPLRERLIAAAQLPVEVHLPYH